MGGQDDVGQGAKNQERAAEDAYRVTGLLGILGSLLRAAAGFAVANRRPR